MIINKRHFSLILYCISILLSSNSCYKNSTSISGSGIRIEVLDDSIIIRNHNTEPVHFLLVERETAAVIDWYPGCEADSPNRIESRKAIEIRYENIFGYHDNCEIIMYWWFCVVQFGEVKASYDMIRSEVIQTK